MKYLLCRPEGGFNDMLCQIYKCYQYCKKHNRCLLLDTKHTSFGLSFHKYFTFINNDNIIYDSDVIFNLINDINNDSFSVHPSVVKDKIFTYK